ncbi:unnamed protein product [Nezara viridula]|uniref:Uncharacterized protein n=1 Tax=Nezara viridula TaxID=85310 RepID=A0A9P0MVQ9_NEZVI|nr:unnamed protein product [Nezara viridula]
MEEESGQLKNWISNFGKDRPISNKPFVGKKPTNTVRNNIGVVESLAALSLGGGTPAEGSTLSPTEAPSTTRSKKSKKRFITVPNKYIEKFNVEDFKTNNYKAIEAVINDILNTRKSKSLAKKSKAKTDIRVKTLGGTLESQGMCNPLEVNKKIKDIKPKSAQPRSYRYYYKKTPSGDKNQLQMNFGPKSLSGLNRIHEEATRSLQNLNGKKTLSRRKAAADEVITYNIEN